LKSDTMGGGEQYATTTGSTKMLKLLAGHWVSQEQFVLSQMPIMAEALGGCGWTTWSVEEQRQASRVVSTAALGLLTQTVGTILTMLEWFAPMLSR